MVPYTKVKKKKATSADPYHVIPIPPKSVVRRLGKVFRIGYYGRRDGLDCIWLVNSDGVYEQTLDHDFLFKHYEIVMLSDESSLYGVRRPKLPPTRKPNGSKIRKSRSR